MSNRAHRRHRPSRGHHEHEYALTDDGHMLAATIHHIADEFDIPIDVVASICVGYYQATAAGQASICGYCNRSHISHALAFGVHEIGEATVIAVSCDQCRAIIEADGDPFPGQPTWLDEWVLASRSGQTIVTDHAGRPGLVAIIDFA